MTDMNRLIVWFRSPIDRFEGMVVFGLLVFMGSVFVTASPQAQEVPPSADVLTDVRRLYNGPNGPVKRPAFVPLGPGAVRPTGWLRDWAETAAEGNTGHLDQLKNTFKHGWTGKGFEAVNERGVGLHWPLEQSAYWLDGLVRLAYILDDPELKRKARKRLGMVVDGVLTQEAPSLIWWEDIGALKNEFNNWAHSHIGRALVAYYRATGNPKILKALRRAYRNYPLPELRREAFSTVSGTTNVDPMLATYTMSGDGELLDQIVSSTGPRLVRQDNGGEINMEHYTDDGWANPPESTALDLRNIFLNRDGSIQFRARVQEGTERTIALVFVEGHWKKPGKRVQDLRVEGGRSRTVDLVADAGPNKPLVCWFRGRDENGDGYIDVEIDAAESAEDTTPILNGLWMFPATQEKDSEALLNGSLWNRVLAYRTPISTSAPFTDRPSYEQLIDRWSSGTIPTGHTVIFHENSRIPAMTYPWTGEKTALAASRRALEWGLKRHGLPVGLASGEEYLAGIGPSRGLETCNVAAGPWTYKTMLRITGERRYGDLIERAVLNAGPASVTRSFNQVCYFQSMNRINSVFRKRGNIGGSFQFSRTGSSTLCCAGNMNRFLPFYIQHMWMATPGGGLAATLYGPNEVRSIVNKGVPVTIQSKTNYPFRTRINMTVTPDRPVQFPLSLRIPGWTNDPHITLNGQPVDEPVNENGFLTIRRKWTAGDRLKIHFPASVKVHRGRTTPIPRPKGGSYFDRVPYNENTAYDKPFATVTYGPLLFARAVPARTPNEAHVDGTSWRYAINTRSEQSARKAEVVTSEMPEHWKWQLDAPLKLRLPAHPFDWTVKRSDPLPDQPVPIEETETITLVPYGSTAFRISMFPVTE